MPEGAVIMTSASWVRAGFLTLALAAGFNAPAAMAQEGAAPASLAPGGAATIYRDRNFSGPAVSVGQDNPNLRLNFRVNSIRLQGGAWELCSQANYRGNCITVRQTTSDLGRALNWGGTLQSMRRSGNGWGGGGGTGGGSGQQQSLRGMASEFFPAPRTNRNPGAARVPACQTGNAGNAACAAQTADRFCRSMGWAGSARELMETENRRVYLADVLCVRTGF